MEKIAFFLGRVKYWKGENQGEKFAERGISPMKTPKGEIPPHLGECESFEIVPNTI